MTPTTADIRRFMVSTFSDEDLKTLCFDYFPDVYDDFTTGMTKGQMIQLLIERCARREAVPNLEAALRAERQGQYDQRFGPPSAAIIPPEIAPTRRDPRQIFVSHAHQDAEFAHRLASDLMSAGWRVWIAPESIQPGEKWVEAIGRGLDGSGVFVIALTPAAVASNWVSFETNAAIELDNRGEVQFIPLDVQSCTVPVLWSVYQRVSFRGCYEDGLSVLLHRLGTVVTALPEAGDRESEQEVTESKRQLPEPPRLDLFAAPAPWVSPFEIDPPEEAGVPEILAARGANLDPRYTFDTFIVGSSNRMAHAVALSVAERPGTAYNPLFIYGGSGLGKTHLLQAIGQCVQEFGKRALYVTSEVFTNEMLDAVRTRTTEEFRAKYRTMDVLLLDDVHFIGGKEQAQEEFLHTFNALHASNRQIVLTSDRPPQAIATLEDRLCSRFGWGMIADIQPPNLETRIAILMAKAASLGQRVPDDVLALIAQRAHNNGRDLEGALTKVLAHAELFKRPLNAALVEDALAYLARAQSKLTPEIIMDVAATYFDISSLELIGRSRTAKIAMQRQIVMYMMCQETGASLHRMGELLGGRDDTTVMYGCEKVAAKINSDPEIARQVAELRKRLYESVRVR